MNKSLLKHEMKSMKWMILLSIITSVFISIMFSSYLNVQYSNIFSNSLDINQAIVKTEFRSLSGPILAIFTALSVVQLFMQFRTEKNQEIGRFLKVLPVKRSEFFKIKLLTGVLNLTLAFIALGLGLLLVRNSNMFWIKDTQAISSMSKIITGANSSVSLLKELGLIYLIILSFYTFLFMVQYTFSNVVGGIVTGTLVWAAPAFIAGTAVYAFDTIFPGSIYNSTILVNILNNYQLLLPWDYIFNYNYVSLPYGTVLGSVGDIKNLWIKYIICLVLILINIIIAYKFNKDSRIEDENKIISFRSTSNIFKFGVTICSGLLVSFIMMDVVNMQNSNVLYILSILIGGFIGYFISRKITQVGRV